MNRRNILVLLLLAALGAVALAGRGLVASSRRAADAAPAKQETRVADTRAHLASALARLTQPLEDQVARAAAVPELKAALADRVDAATLLDLFETEDWWAPFRGRDAAVLIGAQVLAARGEKHPPSPVGLPASPSAPQVTAGLLVGTRPLVAAAAGIALPERSEKTTLLMTAPLDPASLAVAAGIPIALTDGRQLVAATGGDVQRAILTGLVGKESAAVIADGNGLLAVALPAGPGLWVWGLAALPAPPAPASANPRLWGGVAGLLVLMAVLVWTTRRPRPLAQAVAAQPGPPPAAPPTVDASVPPPEPRIPATMILGPTGGSAARDATMFGRYRLLRRLDGGGMADIYTAVLEGAEGFQRTFVIKRLRPELTRSRAAVDQFIDEARLGSRLAHPNIVPVFDFGKVGDEYFMAEEFVVGRDISRLLQRHLEVNRRSLGEQLMLYVAHEVLEALAYAHGQVGADGKPLGIVHRDISPGNIMVTARGDVKLLDFGIVKATGRVSRTEAGVVKGNVAFMSPEQARGEPVDPRSDLFSLGLVIYYGLTSEQIYRAPATFEQLLQAASGPTPEDLSKVADLPIASRVLARALAVDPAQRYQSAGAFAADLAPHVAGGRLDAAALIHRLFGDELRTAAAG
ncbi:MAG TPA: serine/threonine-protein kinase [Polyangia bacterium]|nr:serine/threonine-protein kinase [Polyangia bacterium]